MLNNGLKMTRTHLYLPENLLLKPSSQDAMCPSICWVQPNRSVWTMKWMQFNLKAKHQRTVNGNRSCSIFDRPVEIPIQYNCPILFDKSYTPFFFTLSRQSPCIQILSWSVNSWESRQCAGQAVHVKWLDYKSILFMLELRTYCNRLIHIDHADHACIWQTNPDHYDGLLKLCWEHHYRNIERNTLILLGKL